MAEAARRVAAGYTVVFYPEGTRSRDGRLLPFKKGGFRLALQAQVPILPVAIRGTRELFPPDHWRFRGGRVDAVVREPIETTGLGAADLDVLMERTRASLQAGLAEAAARRVLREGP
jgi:1-acyl-sn-glycerol-3-phosphate acyltransferase